MYRYSWSGIILAAASHATAAAVIPSSGRPAAIPAYAAAGTLAGEPGAILTLADSNGRAAAAAAMFACR